jgi:pimeloyl-ACP methyl ester carboxylesterase
MADFPFSEADSKQYKGPTLFVRGTKSRYVSDTTIPAIKKFFPNAQIADVDAGHWLISEKPEAFRQGKCDPCSYLLVCKSTDHAAVLKFLGNS